MKKAPIFVLSIGVLILAFMIISKDFSNVERIEVHSYKEEQNTFIKTKILKDKESIQGVIGLLNKTSHKKNIEYKLTREADYEVTLFYEAKKPEVVRLWFNFAPRTTMFSSDAQQGVYHLYGKNNAEKLEKWLR